MSEDDLRNVLRMVLGANMDQKITEALAVGIEEMVLFYLKALRESGKVERVSHEAR